MHEVSWHRASPAPWLVSARPGTHPVVAGVTFDTGWLHQPAEFLGVADLLAAWLTARLTRPVEAVDARPDPVQVRLVPDQLDTSLVVTGSAAATGATLRQLAELLSDPGAAEVDDDLRARSGSYANPLARWRSHLAARWPGHRPHLAALGPLALPTLDAAALRAFAGQLAAARRVYWTNDPAVPELAGISVLPPRPAGDLPAPSGWREQPGCVIQRDAAELFTVALPAGAATEISLSLLLRRLQRRMVEFEPLAAGVRVSQYPVGGDLVLACVDADLFAGKDLTDRTAAIVQTLEDLAAGSAPDAEIRAVRDAYADAARTAEPYQPAGMRVLARHHLGRAEFPTQATIAGDYAQVDEATVRERLAHLYPQLLLAMPAEAAEAAPFPITTRLAPREAEGRRFRHRLLPTQSIRCSPRRVAVVSRQPSRRRWSTTASVDFDEVVLRLDAADQSTLLVDRELATVQLVWDVHRDGAALRALVDRHTTGVPVVQQPPDEQWPQRFAKQLRRHRRRMRVGIAGYVIGIGGVLGAVVGAVLDRGDDPPPRTVETVDAGATVSLPDGTTLGIAAGPELIEHYSADRAYTFALQIRMCTGEGRDGDGTYFSSDRFRLDLGEQPQTGFIGIPDRPGPRQGYVGPGECATGWLLYQLTEPDPPAAPTLTYQNPAGDQVTWRLPAEPADSPLSRPCPTVASPLEPTWAGCPTPTG